MKIFLDAKVLISAAKVGSGLYRLVRHLKRTHEVITSDYAETEAFRNLCAKKPDWQDGWAEVLNGVVKVSSIDRPIDVSIADKDRPILATAIAQQSTILLTGDKRDFGHLFGQTVQGVLVLSPGMFTDMLESDQGGLD